MKSSGLGIAALAASFLIAGAALAEPTMPSFQGRPLIDNAHLLNAQQAEALNSKLFSIEKSTKHQVAVVTMPTLDGADGPDYTNRLFRHLALGDKTRNDGVLLFVSMNPHYARIEVGNGLEGVLTDLQTNAINTRDIVPNFKAGDYPLGIDKAVTDIGSVISQEAVAPVAPKPVDYTAAWWLLGATALLAIIAGVFIYRYLKRQRDQELADEAAMSSDLDRRPSELQNSYAERHSSAGDLASGALAGAALESLSRPRAPEPTYRAPEPTPAAAPERDDDDDSSSRSSYTPSSSDDSSTDDTPDFSGDGGTSEGGGSDATW